MEVCPIAAQIGRQVAQEFENGVVPVLMKWFGGEMVNLETAESELAKASNGALCAGVRYLLESCDPGTRQLEWNGQQMHLAERSTEEYHSRFGKVVAERGVYRPAGRNATTVCPMEIRAGIIAGCWTPGAAHLAALVQTDQTVQDAHRFLAEVGITASASTLGRLPLAVSGMWEQEREQHEACLREQATMPTGSTVVSASMDGVMGPLRDKAANRQAKRAAPGKHGSGPSGYREIGCGTVTLYDDSGERLRTTYFGRMPEAKKATVAQQLCDEMLHLYDLAPKLRRVYLADAADVNWQTAELIETVLRKRALALGEAWNPGVQMVDFFHACVHLKAGCDAALGESSPEAKAEFEKLKTKLKEADNGVECVINSLRYRVGRAQDSRQRQRIQTELTYFRNQRSRMRYADYLRQGLPIGSGVVEAACKTLVTQRMKRSGMAWSQAGGQAILTLNTWRRSGYFDRAWQILTNRHQPSYPYAHLHVMPRLKLAA